ncbi:MULTISPECIES: phosphatidylinositol-specific phospholipase C/glycerophosphodiester phosphodiesterase family protein [Paenibacillus]|uniref:phosphatidylinositol-specific phospholipase C/glycerophosphodiester phosphodiesterase family protein n=1 Tax=Paenibacillus TaxID=44249 RepID=UPI002FDF7F3B
MTRKPLHYALLFAGLAILLLFTLSRPQAATPTPSTPGFQAHRVVAHAMGGIEGLTYTNSYEAFIANYEKGTRVFEADLLISKDDQLIARHEWGEKFTEMLGQEEIVDPSDRGAVWSYHEFKEAKILGRYEPLGWKDILDLMERYPDIYVVTDTKQIEPEEFERIYSKIVQSAKKRDASLLDRIVPQIYSRAMWEEVERLHSFEQVIYTLYQSEDTDEQVVEFAKEKRLAAVTMSETRATEKLVSALNSIGVPSYVHTVNDPRSIAQFKRMGVYGFYSDFLSEQDAARAGWTAYLGF